MNGLSAIETRIINRVITNLEALCKAHPTAVVHVEDEEDPVYRGPFDRKKIRESIGHTGMTRLGMKIGNEGGYVLFIHGNEEDVLSDGGWNTGFEWIEQALSKGASE